MCLGALLDAGVPLAYLQSHLDTLGLSQEFSLQVGDTHRCGLRALRVEVQRLSPAPMDLAGAAPHYHGSNDHQSPHRHPHPPGAAHPEAVGPMPVPVPSRNLAAIEHLITQANLPDRARTWSLAVFQRLAEAEAAVHGIATDQVHFHEVGATDAIVDIVGTCLGLDYLGIDSLVCSPLPTGSGQVQAAHGWLPVPAPAVLKLMAMGQIPIYSNGLAGELVTPTGAALVTTLAQQFGPPPALQLRRVGLGAGQKDLAVPNIVRLWLGEAEPEPPWPLAPAAREALAPVLPQSEERVTVLETQVDDMVPQAVGYLYEQLLAAGALDVFTQPIGMKKSRPGLLITVLCQPEAADRCTAILFAETPTLGIRYHHQQRRVLPRAYHPLHTPYGTVTMKVAYHPTTQAVLNVHPEYEDCAALARSHQVPWQVVYQTALSTWVQSQPLPSNSRHSDH